MTHEEAMLARHELLKAGYDRVYLMRETGHKWCVRAALVVTRGMRSTQTDFYDACSLESVAHLMRGIEGLP